MTRHIAHVIDPAGPATSVRSVCQHGAAADIAVMACAQAVLARPDVRHSVIITGTPAAADHARGLGLGDARTQRSPTVLGHCTLGFRNLRAILRALGPVDVLQPWSRRAHRACALAARGRIPVAPVPTGTLPAFNPAYSEAAAVSRERLGVPEALPLVALLCDPTHHADTKRFVYMVGTLQVAGYPVAGLVDRRAGHTARARRFHAESGVAWRVLMPPEPTAALLPACDMAIVLPPPVHQALQSHEAAWLRWSVLRAHLLGVPVVGAGGWLPETLIPTVDPAAHEFFRPWDGSFRDMLRRLISLADDPDHRRRIARTAHQAAARVATSEAYADDLSRLWHSARQQHSASPGSSPE